MDAAWDTHATTGCAHGGTSRTPSPTLPHFVHWRTARFSLSAKCGAFSVYFRGNTKTPEDNYLFRGVKITRYHPNYRKSPNRRRLRHLIARCNARDAAGLFVRPAEAKRTFVCGARGGYLVFRLPPRSHHIAARLGAPKPACSLQSFAMPDYTAFFPSRQPYEYFFTKSMNASAFAVCSATSALDTR